MSNESLFRWTFAAILASAFLISVYFRARARRSGETIPRRAEKGSTLALRALFGFALYLSMFAYIIDPGWMAWSSLPLPVWLRWTGGLAAAAATLGVGWTLWNLGVNVSETYLTKHDHALVTSGPYRWVRHPLYSFGATLFASLGVLAANGFIIAMAFVTILALAWIVIPREEAHLAEKFDDRYQRYRRRTGALFPRF